MPEQPLHCSLPICQLPADHDGDHAVTLPHGQEVPPLDPARTGALINVFGDLLRQTPDGAPLEERARHVLDLMPVEMVQELHEATRRLSGLAEARIEHG